MEAAKESKLGTRKKIRIDDILFFDLDGTLVKTNLSNYLSYQKAIQTVTTVPSIHNDVSERFNRSVLRRVYPNLSEIEYEKIIQLKEEYFKYFLPQTQLNKPVVEILLKYSKTNTTVLVTNCREDRALMTLDYYSLTNHFSSLFFRQFDDTNGKINKFQNAILSMGISPKLVVAFENEDEEIVDAKNAGIQVINPSI